jgi:hypothetical protein
MWQRLPGFDTVCKGLGMCTVEHEKRPTRLGWVLYWVYVVFPKGNLRYFEKIVD